VRLGLALGLGLGLGLLAGCPQKAVKAPTPAPEPAPAPANLPAKVVADFEAAIQSGRDAYVALFDFAAVGEMEILLHRYDLNGRLVNLDDQQKAQLAADQANTAAINQTMQVEAKADHWPTYAWRPFVGFCFGVLALISGLTVAGAYLGVMFLRADPKVLTDIPGMLGAEAAVMATMAPVLGIASYFRGKMQADPRVPTDNRG